MFVFSRQTNMNVIDLGAKSNQVIFIRYSIISKSKKKQNMSTNSLVPKRLLNLLDEFQEF